MTEGFSLKNPFITSIKKRYSLCKPGSIKETVHIEMDLADSGMTYRVGDSLAVLPSNDSAFVEKLLRALGASGDEQIQDPKSKKSINFATFLTKKANLQDCTKNFLLQLARKQKKRSKKAALDAIFTNSCSDTLKKYQSCHDVLETLESHHEVFFSPQEFSFLVKPLLPRFYSISSSQKAVGHQADLTVALKKWGLKGKQRLGVCSHFLCQTCPINTAIVPVYIHPHREFTLPVDPTRSIIMIGPGTGIAPFRGFMQEREFLNCSGKNWLFFGEWNRVNHYFYEDFWCSLEKKGKLRLSLAFSRDQKDKIYVQHKMIEKGKEIFSWLQEGAYLYLCGDALRMAKDVERALQLIIMENGAFSSEKAKEYIRDLRRNKRFLKDVY